LVGRNKNTHLKVQENCLPFQGKEFSSKVQVGKKGDEDMYSGRKKDLGKGGRVRTLRDYKEWTLEGPVGRKEADWPGRLGGKVGGLIRGGEEKDLKRLELKKETQILWLFKEGDL